MVAAGSDRVCVALKSGESGASVKWEGNVSLVRQRTAPVVSAALNDVSVFLLVNGENGRIAAMRECVRLARWRVKRVHQGVECEPECVMTLADGASGVAVRAKAWFVPLTMLSPRAVGCVERQDSEHAPQTVNGVRGGCVKLLLMLVILARPKMNLVGCAALEREYVTINALGETGESVKTALVLPVI